jgi:hypothetical protein
MIKLFFELHHTFLFSIQETKQTNNHQYNKTGLIVSVNIIKSMDFTPISSYHYKNNVRQLTMNH